MCNSYAVQCSPLEFSYAWSQNSDAEVACASDADLAKIFQVELLYFTVAMYMMKLTHRVPPRVKFYLEMYLVS